MNYIKRLQAELGAKDATIANAQDLVTEFLAHLASDKFTGQANDGTRNDWMATSDIVARLMAIRSELHGKLHI